MNYNYVMAIIIICIFAMGCLCCVWITCCGIALMETKFASPIGNSPNDVARDGNPNILVGDKYVQNTLSMKMTTNGQTNFRESNVDNISFLPV